MTHRDALQAAIHELVGNHRVKLFRDGDDRPQWHNLPSLWQQLEDATGREGGGTGGGKVGSRPPISIGVVKLIIEIAQGTAEGAHAHAGKRPPTVPNHLRVIGADLAGRPDDDTDRAYWIWQIQRWVAQARSALALEPKYPSGLRGARCPECGADTAPGQDDDGKPIRVPTLTFVWTAKSVGDDGGSTDREVRAVQCLQCRAQWWRGAEFHQLIAKISQPRDDTNTAVS